MPDCSARSDRNKQYPVALSLHPGLYKGCECYSLNCLDVNQLCELPIRKELGVSGA